MLRLLQPSIFLAVLLTVGSACAAVAVDDKDLLLAFKATFSNGDDVLASWDEADSNPCEGWTYIACNDAGRVERMSLGGPIYSPAVTRNYDNMGRLSSALEGTIPVGGWELPDTLLYLQLDNNNIHGSLDGWLLPPGLKELWLQRNSITGNLSTLVIPDTLEKLGLGFNQFSGPLPEDWELPQTLTDLWLSYCNFTGRIPDSWPHLPSNVLLQGNNLSGPLPTYDNSTASICIISREGGNGGLCGEVPTFPTYTVESTPTPDQFLRDNYYDVSSYLQPCE